MTDIPNHDELLDDPLYRRWPKVDMDAEADDPCADDSDEIGDY